VSEQDVGVWEEKGFARRGSVCIMVWVLYLHMREGRRGGSTYIHTYIHTCVSIYPSTPLMMMIRPLSKLLVKKSAAASFTYLSKTAIMIDDAGIFHLSISYHAPLLPGSRISLYNALGMLRHSCRSH